MLFRYDDPTAHAQQLYQHFRGQTITYEAINEYALNESPFANPKAMLRSLEAAGEISVTSPRVRRKGTFPDDAQQGMTVHFLG